MPTEFILGRQIEELKDSIQTQDTTIHQLGDDLVEAQNQQTELNNRVGGLEAVLHNKEKDRDRYARRPLDLADRAIGQGTRTSGIPIDFAQASAEKHVKFTILLP